MKLNIYRRKDGRFEGRLAVGKKSRRQNFIQICVCLFLRRMLHAAENAARPDD
ncbi:hypothetical protein [Megamonas sp.]